MQKTKPEVKDGAPHSGELDGREGKKMKRLNGKKSVHAMTIRVIDDSQKSNSRHYEIVFIGIDGIYDQPMTIEFSKALSVEGVRVLLGEFMKDLRRYGFETPYAWCPVEPTGEDGAYKVTDGVAL